MKPYAAIAYRNQGSFNRARFLQLRYTETPEQAQSCVANWKTSLPEETIFEVREIYRIEGDTTRYALPGTHAEYLEACSLPETEKEKIKKLWGHAKSAMNRHGRRDSYRYGARKKYNLALQFVADHLKMNPMVAEFVIHQGPHSP